MSIERIVAEYETCKKASTIGLHLKTIFHWIDITPHMEEGRQAVYCIEEIFPNFHFIQASEEEKNSFIIDTGFAEYTYLSLSAPTVEEVPLPDYFRNNIDVSITCDRNYYYVIYTKENKKKKHQLDRFKYGLYAKFNEATARLKMAIWLIENVPEARQWYVDNGYLKEGDK